MPPPLPKGIDPSPILETVSRLAADPQAKLDFVTAAVRDLQPIAPQTAQAAAASVANGIDYLASKAPAQVTTSQGKTVMSQVDRIEFARAFQRVSDPVAVLRSGFTGEDWAAINAIYPRLADVFRGEVIYAMSHVEHPTPQQQRKIDLVMGTGTMPAEPSLPHVMLPPPQMPPRPARSRGGLGLRSPGAVLETTSQRLAGGHALGTRY